MTSTLTLNQNPRDDDFCQNPYAVYNQLHDNRHPFYWENYGFWCVSSYKEVNSILRDRRFARLPPAGHEKKPMPAHLGDFASSECYSLLALEPPTHTRIRKRVNQAFVNRQVALMQKDIESLAAECLDAVETNDEFELIAQYATPIPINVITGLLGVPESAGQQLLLWSHAMVKVYTLTQTRQEEEDANKAAREFRDFLNALIEKKRLSPADDLLSELVKKDDDGKYLSDEEITCTAILLLNAGHEATVHQIGNAVHTLLKHYPENRRDELLDLLQNDKRADALVTECLRYSAPLHLFTRYAQTGISLSNGVDLKAGDEVGLLLAAANRCPERFDNPDEFIHDRGDSGHLSLGAGIHFCVGAHLAKLEIRVALQCLFKRFPTLYAKETPRYKNSYHFHGLESLRVSWSG